MGDQEHLVTVLKGHLVIEALLVEVIQLRKPGDKAWKLTFPEKVAKCVAEGRLPAHHAPIYLKLNDIRNDYSHILGHDLTHDDVFELVKEMGAVGYDFSDETIYLNKELSAEWYGVGGCLIEALNNMHMELAWVLHENGGPNRLG